MKIGILGWYHQNNAGDDRILECLSKKLTALGVKNIEVFIAWDDLGHKIDNINQCDFLIIGGGGLILRNTNMVVGLLDQVKIPFGFLGISVDSVGADNSLFISYIAANTKFILVRDSYSYNVFKSFDATNLYQAADLTFLYPYKKSKIESTEKKTIALSLRAWRPNLFKQYTKNYHRFNHWVHKAPFLTKLFGLWDEQSFVKIITSATENHIVPFPLHICENGCDNKLLSNYFEIDDKSEFDISTLSQSDYLVGMRLHALIFATQLGVPFIALNYANKVNQFAELVNMSDYVLELKDYKSISTTLQKLKNNDKYLSDMLLEKTKIFEEDVNKTVSTILKEHIL